MNRISKVKYFLLLLGIVFVLGGCGKEEINTEDLTTNNLNTEESTTDDISDGVNLKTNLDNAQDDKITITKHESTNDVGSLLSNSFNINDNCAKSIREWTTDCMTPELQEYYEELYNSGFSVFADLISMSMTPIDPDTCKVLYGDKYEGENIDLSEVYKAILMYSMIGMGNTQPDRTQKLSWESEIEFAIMMGLDYNTDFDTLEDVVGEVNKVLKNEDKVRLKEIYKLGKNGLNEDLEQSNYIAYEIQVLANDDVYYIVLPKTADSHSLISNIDSDKTAGSTKFNIYYDKNGYKSSEEIYIDTYALHVKYEDASSNIVVKQLDADNIPGMYVHTISDSYVPDWIDVYNTMDKMYIEYSWNELYDSIYVKESDDELKQLALIMSLLGGGMDSASEDMERITRKYCGDEFTDNLMNGSGNNGEQYDALEIFNFFDVSSNNEVIDPFDSTEDFDGSTEDVIELDFKDSNNISKYDNIKVSGTQVVQAIDNFLYKDMAIVIQTKELANSDSVNKSGIDENEKGMAFNYGALLTKDGKVSNGVANIPDLFIGLFDGNIIQVEPASNGSYQFITSESQSVYLVSYAETQISGVSLHKNKNNYYLGELHNSKNIIDYNLDISGVYEEENSQYINQSGRFSSNLIKNGSGDIIGVFFKQLN